VLKDVVGVMKRGRLLVMLNVVTGGVDKNV